MQQFFVLYTLFSVLLGLIYIKIENNPKIKTDDC